MLRFIYNSIEVKLSVKQLWYFRDTIFDFSHSNQILVIIRGGTEIQRKKVPKKYLLEEPSLKVSKPSNIIGRLAEGN